MTSFESVLNQPRVVWLRENAWNVDKRILLLLGILLWLHGVTVGIVFEGQKGLLNRFLWTFVVGLLPCVLFVKYKSWRRTAVILLYFELATFIMVRFNFSFDGDLADIFSAAAIQSLGIAIQRT